MTERESMAQSGERGTKKPVVLCLKGWKCGFYPSFDEAAKSGFTWCMLCGNFLGGER